VEILYRAMYIRIAQLACDSLLDWQPLVQYNGLAWDRLDACSTNRAALFCFLDGVARVVRPWPWPLGFKFNQTKCRIRLELSAVRLRF